MVLDIDDDDGYELEMEKSITDSVNLNERQRDFRNWVNTLRKVQKDTHVRYGSEERPSLMRKYRQVNSYN